MVNMLDNTPMSGDSYSDTLIGIFTQRCVNVVNNIMNKFYVLSKEKNNLLTRVMSSKMKKICGMIKVHDKYKLVTFYNNDFYGKTDQSSEIVYVLLLENDDKTKVYGVYANGGILVETCREDACIKMKLM